MAGVKGKSGGKRIGAGRKPGPDSLLRHIPKLKIERDDIESFVYIIYESDDPVICKIGVASDLVKRLGTMQVGTWRALRIGHAIKFPSKSAAHAVERHVHQAFSALHVRGEWFRVSPDRAASELDLAALQLRAAFVAVSEFSKA